MGLNIMVFPEYSIEFSDLGIDPNRPPDQNEAIIESANSSYSSFVSLRHDMKSLGFPDNETSFGFTFEQHSICYRSFILEKYCKDQLEAYGSYFLNGRRSTRTASLLSLSQLSLNIVKLNLNPFFKPDPNDSRGEWTHWINETLGELIDMKDRIEILLENNEIEVTVENVLKCWSLEYFATSNMSCRTLTPSFEENMKFQGRIISLLQYPLIPLVDCFTALSWYGNLEYKTTGLFTHSPESIMALQGAPQSFKDYFFFGASPMARLDNDF